ncbi:MAG: hypothetical protein K2M59_02220 [Muribaculaceae bacterium]|nr:hypothetical protein [Muribaculaceae bacterium]
MQTNASTRIYGLEDVKQEMSGLSNGVNREIDGGLHGHINIIILIIIEIFSENNKPNHLPKSYKCGSIQIGLYKPALSKYSESE